MPTWASSQPRAESISLRLLTEHRCRKAAEAPAYRLDRTYLLDQPLADMRTYLERIGRDAELDAFVPFAEVLRARVVALPTHPGAFGILHGDPHGENVHFDDAGRVTLFDFDHGGYGWRTWDVGTALGRLPGPTRVALLAGYEAVRPLTDAERQAIPVLRALRPLWSCGDIVGMRVAWGHRGRGAQRRVHGGDPERNGRVAPAAHRGLISEMVIRSKAKCVVEQ